MNLVVLNPNKHDCVSYVYVEEFCFIASRVASSEDISISLEGKTLREALIKQDAVF